MRKLAAVLHYLGVVLIAFAFLQALPLVVSAIYAETVEFPFRIYVIPAAISIGIGLGLVTAFRPRPLEPGTGMAVAAIGWFGLSLIGAVPYWLALKITFLDALFETTSGFTTTGMTIFTGIDGLPHSILFWRALTQWIGGLGIFTLFLFIARGSGTPALYLAESHKAATKRFSPGLFSSLRILWGIYAGLTLLCGLLLWAEGMDPFDAAVHALTTVSTGGFSTHDASIAYFASYPHYAAIEGTIILFMFLGGTSFIVHWNLLRRRWDGIIHNSELKLWLGVLIAATLAVAFLGTGAGAIGSRLRIALFQVVSIATSTGFSTVDINSPTFTPLAHQIFLLLMLIGGCVGSTSGGMKVRRIGIIGRIVRQYLQRASRPAHAVVAITYDGEIVPREELNRTVVIAFSWLGVIAVGALVTGAFTSLPAFSVISGMVSAVGNMGPSFIPRQGFAGISPVIKVFYILGMVAGRLEILPILLIFSRRVWR